MIMETREKQAENDVFLGRLLISRFLVRVQVGELDTRTLSSLRVFLF